MVLMYVSCMSMCDVLIVVFHSCVSLSVQCEELFLGSWFFFFKQKTAYEMRISDWSSDVCSSDLSAAIVTGIGEFAADVYAPLNRVGDTNNPKWSDGAEIGRASCRERVCQYV